MPLSRKGKKIRRAMTRFYGPKKGLRIFYASEKTGILGDDVLQSKKRKAKRSAPGQRK